MIKTLNLMLGNLGLIPSDLLSSKLLLKLFFYYKCKPEPKTPLDYVFRFAWDDARLTNLGLYLNSSNIFPIDIYPAAISEFVKIVPSVAMYHSELEATIGGWPVRYWHPQHNLFTAMRPLDRIWYRVELAPDTDDEPSGRVIGNLIFTYIWRLRPRSPQPTSYYWYYVGTVYLIIWFFGNLK